MNLIKNQNCWNFTVAQKVHTVEDNDHNSNFVLDEQRLNLAIQRRNAFKSKYGESAFRFADVLRDGYLMFYENAFDSDFGVDNSFNAFFGEKPPSFTPLGAGRRGAFREAKRLNRIPVSQVPEKQVPNVDLRKKRQPGRQYVFKIERGVKEKPNVITIRDDAGGHNHPDDPSQNRGPHFNDEEKRHFDYEPRGRKRR